MMINRNKKSITLNLKSDAGKALFLKLATVYDIAAKMSQTSGQIRLPAPTLGQHTDAILKSMLALTEQQIADLRSQQVIA